MKESADKRNEATPIKFGNILARTGLWEREVTKDKPLRLRVCALFASNTGSKKITPLSLTEKGTTVPLMLELYKDEDGTKYANVFTRGRKQPPERIEFNEFQSGIRAIAARNNNVFHFSPEIFFQKVE
jgi:hypothetical protein